MKLKKKGIAISKSHNEREMLMLFVTKIDIVLFPAAQQISSGLSAVGLLIADI